MTWQRQDRRRKNGRINWTRRRLTAGTAIRQLGGRSRRERKVHVSCVKLCVHKDTKSRLIQALFGFLPRQSFFLERNSAQADRVATASPCGGNFAQEMVPLSKTPLLCLFGLQAVDNSIANVWRDGKFLGQQLTCSTGHLALKGNLVFHLHLLEYLRVRVSGSSVTSCQGSWCRNA